MELGNVIKKDRSIEWVFGQNIDLIFDTLVRKLQLFTEEEWKKWRYQEIYLPKLKQAA